MKAAMKTVGVCCGPVIVTDGWIYADQRNAVLKTVVDIAGATTQMSNKSPGAYPIYASLERSVEVELPE